ncbi:hypothetical protein Cob_v004788 [Colletotrichum orbiculare MAFF 240422]|uniref:Uncharacterized protein n=1 Tax=Colletotrichum orbiculare (strain 104-T / ATCC 96160 / CBS 514.97 / LARS 414 / MAFF 240422) TaxID=1213857 RepID=A0A484FX37_COLOR|nr:hypothetical protein Cob_v004788 [Colletotrichum orbiculare MAFF 240422]
MAREENLRTRPRIHDRHAGFGARFSASVNKSWYDRSKLKGRGMGNTPGGRLTLHLASLAQSLVCFCDTSAVDLCPTPQHVGRFSHCFPTKSPRFKIASSVRPAASFAPDAT